MSGRFILSEAHFKELINSENKVKNENAEASKEEDNTELTGEGPKLQQREEGNIRGDKFPVHSTE